MNIVFLEKLNSRLSVNSSALFPKWEMLPDRATSLS